MRPDPKILDDIARVAGGAVNLFSGVQQQVRDEIKSRMDEMASRMDLVPRDELDRALAMIAALEKRVAALEGKKAAAPKTAPKPKKAPAAKKPAASKGKKKAR